MGGCSEFTGVSRLHGLGQVGQNQQLGVAKEGDLQKTGLDSQREGRWDLDKV